MRYQCAITGRIRTIVRHYRRQLVSNLHLIDTGNNMADLETEHANPAPATESGKQTQSVLTAWSLLHSKSKPERGAGEWVSCCFSSSI